MSAAIRRRWAPRAALVVPVLVLVLAGCGTKNAGADNGVASAANAQNAKGKATTTTTMNDEAARLAFTKCLREHGIDVDDSGPGTLKGRAGSSSDKKEQGIRIHGSGDNKKMDAAMKACQKYAPNGGQPPKLDPKQIEAVRKMAACMRSHGVPSFPDPDKTGLLKLEFIQGKSDPTLDPENKTFTKAMEACRGDDVPMMMSRTDGGPGKGSGPEAGSSGGGQ
jgi:hypothetical protein